MKSVVAPVPHLARLVSIYLRLEEWYAQVVVGVGTTSIHRSSLHFLSRSIFVLQPRRLDHVLLSCSTVSSLGCPLCAFAGVIGSIPNISQLRRRRR